MKMKNALDHLAQWCANQENLRLILGPPLTDHEIDELPIKIASNCNSGLTIPFEPNEFHIPTSYREFLRLHSYARIEIKINDKWSVYEPFNIFSLDEVAEGKSFCSEGTTLEDDREIYTTFLVAFASAGFNVEASRWCFYTDPDIISTENEYTILLEDNDFQCSTAKYVDSRNWIDDATCFANFFTFEEWLVKLVESITRIGIQGPTDNEVGNALLTHKKT